MLTEGKHRKIENSHILIVVGGEKVDYLFSLSPSGFFGSSEKASLYFAINLSRAFYPLSAMTID